MPQIIDPKNLLIQFHVFFRLLFRLGWRHQQLQRWLLSNSLLNSSLFTVRQQLHFPPFCFYHGESPTHFYFRLDTTPLPNNLHTVFNSLRPSDFSIFPPDVTTWLQGFTPIQPQQHISEVQHWCYVDIAWLTDGMLFSSYTYGDFWNKTVWINGQS